MFKLRSTLIWNPFVKTHSGVGGVRQRVRPFLFPDSLARKLRNIPTNPTLADLGTLWRLGEAWTEPDYPWRMNYSLASVVEACSSTDSD